MPRLSLSRFNVLPVAYAGAVAMPAMFVLARLLINADKACFDYHFGVREGWAVERLTFVFLALGALLALVNAVQRYPRQRLHALFFLGMAGALFVGAGEEVSWGQRVLDIETPEWLTEVNSQDEINLHNTLEGLTDFSTNKALELSAFAFGVVGPLAARKGRVPLPSLLLVPGFFCAGLLMQGRQAEFEKEVGEMVISIGLFAYLWMALERAQDITPRLNTRALVMSSLVALVLVPVLLSLLRAACPL